MLVSYVKEVGEVLEEAGTDEISMFDNGSGNNISVPAGGLNNWSWTFLRLKQMKYVLLF